MPWWKKKKTTDVDALLEATQDWKPYAGADYDQLRLSAEQHCAKAQRTAKPVRWWQPWRWFDTPCQLLQCKRHSGASGVGHALAMAGLFGVGLTCFVAMGRVSYWSSIPFAFAAVCGIVSGFFFLEAARNGWDARRAHAQELDRLLTRMGYMGALTAYLLKEARMARAALIGEKAAEKSAAELVAELAGGGKGETPADEYVAGNAPLRVAQRKLAGRLEEVHALLVRITASLMTEHDERLIAVLRSGQHEAATLEVFVAGMKAKVDERIAQIKAFFDECEARIIGLEAPIRVMAMKAELALHRNAAEGEAVEAEQAITGALIDLQSKWLTFQQTANTLLPPVVAKVFGETAGIGDEKQNLETLEATMDRVFDALPPPFDAAQDRPFDQAQSNLQEPVKVS